MNDYEAWVVYRHLMCCLLCRQLVAFGQCGMCTDRWKLLS